MVLGRLPRVRAWSTRRVLVFILLARSFGLPRVGFQVRGGRYPVGNAGGNGTRMGTTTGARRAGNWALQPTKHRWASNSLWDLRGQSDNRENNTEVIYSVSDQNSDSKYNEDTVGSREAWEGGRASSAQHCQCPPPEAWAIQSGYCLLRYYMALKDRTGHGPDGWHANFSSYRYMDNFDITSEL